MFQSREKFSVGSNFNEVKIMVVDQIDSVDSDITVEQALSFITSCDLVHIAENKYTKSIYFKDQFDNLSCIIYSLANSSATIFTTVKGVKFNFSINAEEFRKIFNKYKIFIIK